MEIMKSMGVNALRTSHNPPEHQTMGEAFRASGYHPHIVGKWHQDNASLKRSFDSGDRIMGRSAYLVDHLPKKQGIGL